MSIFDVSDLSDLPPELIKELRLAGDADTPILELFVEAAAPLNLTSLLVGYYRKHKQAKTRQFMMTTCYRLMKKGFLISTSNKGEYRITENGLRIARAEIVEQETEETMQEGDIFNWLCLLKNGIQKE